MLPNALDYYWEVQSSGITGFAGDLILNYLQEDVVGDESNYLSARLMVPGTNWSTGSSVDNTLNTDPNQLFSRYCKSQWLNTLLVLLLLFLVVYPVFKSNADGNWTDPIWTHVGGDAYTLAPGSGPNGLIVIINNIVTLNVNSCSAYRTTINTKLKVVSPFYGHNLGTVDGSGTLYLESGSFPAGVFTNIFKLCK